MRLFFYLKYSLLFFTLLFFSSMGKASHIRAGEITAVKIGTSTYALTLTIYANRFSTVRDPYALLEFGDNTSALVFFANSEVNLNAETYIRTYKYNKTYSGNGTFRVSYSEKYRNGDIKNIAFSDNTEFYIETYLSISSFTGPNNTVKLTVPPIDRAAVGELFVHNPGAIDVDGDSLSYKMIVPKQAPGVAVNGYFTPNFSSSFTLDPVTGDLRWDAPTIPGLYNVAFIIEEWRKSEDGSISRVSFVTRDMQIEVINSLNNPPVVTIPQDTCVVAGTNLIKVISATDPDNNSINLTAFPSTYFTVVNPQVPIATGTFNWQTQCLDVREQPYSFVFKAEDVVTRDTLTDYKTWLVKIKGPAPTGLNAVASGNSITLTWDAYICSNAKEMEVYRKSCDSTGYVQLPCESGITSFPGYVKIGEVPITTTTFLDTNLGKGLSKGVEYCYIIVAKFPYPKGGESYASSESCENALLDVPVLTNVSVIVSSVVSGSIQLNWLAPVSSPLPSPYTYNIHRADGIAGTNFSLITTVTTLSFIDSGINTFDKAYRYKIELIGGGNSDPASSVFVKTLSAINSIKIEWENDVPWREDSVFLFRSLNGASYIQIANLKENPKIYIDQSGLTNCDTACYYTQIFSSYCDPLLPSLVYNNLSQQSCASPSDGKIPEAPLLSVKGCEGDLSIFYNQLDWNSVADPLCNNIKNYNVYFSNYSDSELNLIAVTDFSTTNYTYTNFKSTAGCFAVAAVSETGVEGNKSEKICVDDCIYYELPNLITPNGDSLNDKFRPFPIPRGVEVVTFKVYNRWGALVYSTDNSIQINWTAISFDNKKLLDGVYYFSADVKYFRRKNKEDENRQIKGWVQVLDQEDARNFE